MYYPNFQQEFSFKERYDEAHRVLKKFPDRRPIICEKSSRHSNLPNIDKKKYLVPVHLTIAQFMFVIKKRIKLLSHEALFLFINNKMVSGNTDIGQLYDYYRDSDGFLYIQYAKENTFG